MKKNQSIKKQQKQKHSFWPLSKKPIAIAHRGGAGNYSVDRFRRENTIDVFKAARKLGYDYLELDVTATADGKAIVMHVTTDRFEALLHKPSAPNAKRLKALTYDKLKTRLNRDIPTLSEILKEFPDAKFLIDSKTDEAVGPIAEEIIKTKAYNRVYLNSFYIHRVMRFQELLGDKVTYGLIIGRYPRLVNRKLKALKNLEYKNLDLTAIVVPYRFMNKDLLDLVHKQGLKVIVWTPNTASRINKAIKLGVDGIVSDNISLLKRILDSKSS